MQRNEREKKEIEIKRIMHKKKKEKKFQSNGK